MSISRPWAVICIALLGVCAPGQSRAELAAETQDLADRGMEAVRHHEWDMGIKYFKEAVAQAPTEPALLFNLALASDKGAKSLAANLYYRAYLALEPDGQSAARVRKRIAELDVKIESDALVLLRKGRELVDNQPRKAATGIFPCSANYEAISAYEHIGKSLLRLGDYAAMGDAIESVIKLCPGDEVTDYRTLVKELSAVGNDAEAYAIAAKAADHAVKSHFSTRSPVTNGFDEAGVYRQIYIAGMLENIAEGKIERGDIQGAMKLLAEAGEKGGGIPPDWRYPAVANRQTELGDIPGALATLALIKSPGRGYAEALYRISRRQSADGDVQAAQETIGKAQSVASTVADNLDKPGLNRELAISYAAAGMIAKAIKARDAIPEKDSARDAADIAIAAALVRAGAVVEAKNRVAEMYASAKQFEAYRDIAHEQAKAGDIPGAESTILLIGDLQTKYEAKSRVAEARGKAREAHSLALQATAYGSDFKLYESYSEKGKQLKAEDPMAVARNFIDRAAFSLLALEDMRKTDAKWKKQVSPGKPGL